MIFHPNILSSFTHPNVIPKPTLSSGKLKKLLWRMFVTKQFWVPLNSTVWINNIMEVNRSRNCLVTYIHQNIFFQVPQKKEMNTSLRGVNDEVSYFCVNYPKSGSKKSVRFQLKRESAGLNLYWCTCAVWGYVPEDRSPQMAQMCLEREPGLLQG